MAKIVDKTVKLKLTGRDGNAFSLMGAFQSAAKKQGWTGGEIQQVLDECMSGDYRHLLATLAAHCEGGGVGSDDEDDEE